jgi:hypothetical protein
MKYQITILAMLISNVFMSQAITVNHETCEETFSIKEGDLIDCDCEFVLSNKTNKPQEFNVLKDCGCVLFDILDKDGDQETKGIIPPQGQLKVKVIFKVEPNAKNYPEKIAEIRESGDSKLAEVGLKFTGLDDFITLTAMYYFKFQ